MEKIDILIVEIWDQLNQCRYIRNPFHQYQKIQQELLVQLSRLGNIYVKIRDTLGSIYVDEDFKDLFSVKGQPAQSPWRLAFICVMQYMENLSDRQAADAVRGRIDWKYALSLPLEDSGFDFSAIARISETFD